ncbi:hypothetical protein HANVADRAFT_53332 [Hanseniaspora valbyensis NRRL Y-1626]|uniref:DUF1531-domain-containing protein n=1 Tax=Hanseniaspora valbyensis NRRL Y-1626 TaxID=766949 RepID=A0A1B7TBV2_9ASCO|nr:hypothetical protein HANVADRAFT_53332 [Hanseniaspora valbyensis NRRL Y-1626]
MSSFLSNFKDSIVELRQAVNHHYADKDALADKQASIFAVNYKFWNYVYQYLWSKEITSYNDLVNHIQTDSAINSINWKRMYTIIIIVCVYSLFRTRLLKNYEKTKLDQMVDENKQAVWKELNKNKEKGVSEWDGDYNTEVSQENEDNEEEKNSNSTGFSFGKKSKAKYKKNVKLLQKKYEEIQLQKQLQQEQDDDDDLADIADLLED